MTPGGAQRGTAAQAPVGGSTPQSASAPTRPARPNVELTAADVAAANALVTRKDARAPYLRITLADGRVLPGYDLISLPQDRALAEDLYVLLLLKCRQATGKLVPPPMVEQGAKAILERPGQGQFPTWKLNAIRRFWGGQAATRFTPAELAAQDFVPSQFVTYLLDKQNVLEALRNARLGAQVAALEQWNRAMASWQSHESRTAQAGSGAQSAREGYLTEWDAQWAVDQAAAAVEGGR